jgi:hypothetical protein
MDDARRMMVVCAALFGCSHGGMTDDGGRSTFDPAETGGAEDPSGPASEESGPAPDDGEESSGAPDAESSGGSAPLGRCDKVDILFVLEAPEHPPLTGETADCYWDDTAEWQEWYGIASEYSTHYGKLVDGFDTLVSELYVTLQVPDFQVLVTGSLVPNPQFWNGMLDPTGMCGPALVELDACDQTLGAGRNGYTVPTEADPGNVYPGECMAERYVPSGSMDLPSTFWCLAHDEHYYWEDYYRYGGYTGDGPDQLMDAMTAAVGSSGEAATCNAGFLRDDAVLVVVLLEVGMDDLADTSTGTTQAWKDALVAAKGGAEDRVVVLTLSPDGADEHPLCAPASASTFASDLRSFTESFTHGLWSSSCLLEYPTFFRAGAELIDAACGDDPEDAPG